MAANKLFVGNLSWSIDSDGLRDLFSEFGTVEDAFVMTERGTGRSKGFGFVTFSTDEEAAEALEAMNGKEVEGRSINVDVARPKRDEY